MSDGWDGGTVVPLLTPAAEPQPPVSPENCPWRCRSDIETWAIQFGRYTTGECIVRLFRHGFRHRSSRAGAAAKAWLPRRAQILEASRLALDASPTAPPTPSKPATVPATPGAPASGPSVLPPAAAPSMRGASKQRHGHHAARWREGQRRRGGSLHHSGFCHPGSRGVAGHDLHCALQQRGACGGSRQGADGRAGRSLGVVHGMQGLAGIGIRPRRFRPHSRQAAPRATAGQAGQAQPAVEAVDAVMQPRPMATGGRLGNSRAGRAGRAGRQAGQRTV